MERANNQRNLRNHDDFITPNVHTGFHGTKCFSYLEPKIRDIASDKFKHKK